MPIVVCVLMLNAVCDDEELNRKFNSYSSKEEKKNVNVVQESVVRVGVRRSEKSNKQHFIFQESCV